MSEAPLLSVRDLTVAFRTEGTKPAPGESRSACTLTDCLLLSGGDAISTVQAA